MFKRKKELPSPKPDPPPIFPKFEFWSVILILILLARVVFQLDAITASLRYDGQKELPTPSRLPITPY